MDFITWHPHTKEPCRLSNREWRCLKVGIAIDSTMWELLSAEKGYKLLLTCAVERHFDPPTMEWLCGLIDAWPVDICSSPQALAMWYKHLSDVIDIDTYIAQLSTAAELQAKLDSLMAKRHKEAVKLVKSMQRDLDKLRKLKQKQEIAKRKRKAAQLKLLRRR